MCVCVCKCDTEALKHQSWYTVLTNSLPQAEAQPKRASREFSSSKSVSGQVTVEHGTTPNSVWYNQHQHLLMLSHSFQHSWDTGLLTGNFSFPEADPGTSLSSHG